MGIKLPVDKYVCESRYHFMELLVSNFFHFNMMFSRFIHVIALYQYVILLWVCNSCLYIWATFCVSKLDEHLGLLHFFGLHEKCSCEYSYSDFYGNISFSLSLPSFLLFIVVGIQQTALCMPSTHWNVWVSFFNLKLKQHLKFKIRRVGNCEL